MNRGQSQLTRERDSSVAHDSSLTVDDLIKYLSRLASLNGEYRTGNQDLSDGLQELARALRPHAGRTVSDFADQMKEMSRRPEATASKRKATLPASLESLSRDEIERMLNSENYTKTQIMEIGNRRFGIPESKLARASKKDALTTVAAALDHERSLEVIARQAGRGDRMS
jgi:hypothetical protein